MTGKVKSRKSKTGGLAFGTSSVCLFILVLSYAFLLFGCNSPQANVVEADRIKNMPAEARKADLLKLLDHKFENPDAHFELAQLYQAEGLLPKAEYHYNVALGFDPANVEAQAAMVKLFLDSGDTAKSKTYADIHINQTRASATQSLRLAMAFQKQQLDEYALACYQQALHLAPSSAKVHKHIGLYYLTKNDNTRAKEHLTQSFQLDPKQPEVAGELGRLGVEVRIPRKTERDIKKLEKDEKEYKILVKHGLIQVEQSGKKKVKTNE
ncbi:MAG: tetratricopeptide repeat protein [Planctomycetota bacterium]